MYLKNLTIYGFKSFANRTVLEFPSNLLGIVGPNGSGKSNICDSIRWVLGEQSSKALRGQKMDDVIFGGTSMAQPAKFCEVRLTFDNRTRFFKMDSDEFVLTRKIYRTGESEYIINGEQCRLKDIKEKIMDTGLGRDAYSIIGQGMVDNIISSRGNERRAIIEEAAGIVKYKADKNESLRKIADTQINIDRLTDLMVELEKQLGPLSMQAQIARRYIELMERLKNKKLKKLVYEFDFQRRELAQQRAVADEYHRKREEHSQKIIVFTAETEALQAKIVTLNDKYARLKKDNYDILSEQETLQNVEKEFLTKITQINTNRESYVRSLDEVDDHIEALELENKEIAIEIESSEKYRADIEIEIKKLQEDIGTLSARLKSGEKQLTVSQDTSIENLNELAKVKTRLNQKESELKYNAQELRRLGYEIDRLQTRINDYKEKSSAGESDQSNNIRRHAELKKKLMEAEEKLRDALENEKRLLRSIQDNSAELISVRAQIKAQEDVRRNLDGFKFGVKFILGARQQKPEQFKGICGPVSELVGVAPEYEIALEVALGGNMQSIIVEKARDTENCIDLLKRNKAGRVTFLPLDTVRPGPPAVIPSGLKGFIGVAADLVKYDAKYRNVFEYLLNPVLIVDTLQHANEFVSRNRFSGRIVTLEGELITASGAITGGSLDKHGGGAGGHFGNSGALDALKSRSVYLDDKIGQDNIKLDSIRKRLEDLKNEIDKLKIELTRLEAFAETAGKSGIDYARMLENAGGEMISLVELVESYNKKSSALEPEIEGDRKIIAMLEEKLQLERESLQKSKSSQSEERDEFEKLSRLLTDRKVEQAAINQNISNYRRKIIDNRNEIDSLIKRNSGNKDDLLKYEDKFKECSAQLIGIQNKINEIKSKTSDIKKQEDEITKELETLSIQLKSKEGMIAFRNKQSAEMLAKIHEIEIKQAEIEVNTRNTLNILESEYKLREDEFNEYRDETFKYEGAAAEIDEIQLDIDRLGIVNRSAIDDYNSLQERVNELKTQRDDLISARDGIYKIVEKSDAECSRLFNDTFNKINDYIGEIFQMLFSGGSAKLVLEDPSKPLECNIDIKAQPPGKKLQSITLMSGGEKSLTALSLLFAILRVKPSPFCILDEVEAALDEYNVLRFIKMLNNFKDKTQFLIITHNKQTMQHLDLLYGVTMEEKGISKIISVQLEQAYDIIAADDNRAAAEQNVA